LIDPVAKDAANLVALISGRISTPPNTPIPVPSPLVSRSTASASHPMVMDLDTQFRERSGHSLEKLRVCHHSNTGDQKRVCTDSICPYLHGIYTISKKERVICPYYVMGQSIRRNNQCYMPATDCCFVHAKLESVELVADVIHYVHSFVAVWHRRDRTSEALLMSALKGT
jgi:hypothetical protein